MNVLLFEGQDRGPREGTRWEGFPGEAPFPWARPAREGRQRRRGVLQVFLA